MGVLKRLVIAFVVLIALICVGGLFISPQYEVKRQIEVRSSADYVYQHVADLKAWQKWGVWFKRDPDMKVEYSGASQGVTAKSSWKSETQGSGEMTITHAEPAKMIQYNLYFPDMDMTSIGKMTFTQLDNGNTLIEWSDSGDMGYNIVNRYFTLFLDDMLGPDFEEGLKNLKALTEK
ncbi:SRPBCC family protein [Pleionea sp. CnH1-48]|uniref:SRPBCC family protein n=1 Tax=Pleionea sp. CnH1-48 TaxID=2954494 RepID=UPI002097EB28|nr:SRPBCC family protein [Pleionea sp. CnH1-48]MCO7225628.1 SRPBCC family protein [Pleionea sp. CnH1-48]